MGPGARKRSAPVSRGRSHSNHWAHFALLTAPILVGAAGPVRGLPSSGVGTVRTSSAVPVTAVNLSRPASQNSPLLAANPDEPRLVALASRIDGPSQFGCQLHLSGDGGTTWIPARPVPTLPKGAERCYAPEIAFDAKGTLYYLFTGLHGRGNTPMGVFLTTSRDWGRSFGVPRRILGANNYSVRMGVDRERDRLHLVWLHATAEPSLGGLPPTSNPIQAAHSDDGGMTFSMPVVVSDAERPRAVAPGLALGPRGSVHVAYYDLQRDAIDYQGLEGPAWQGTWSLVVSTSGDAGGHFGPGTVIDDTIVPPERVMLIFTMPPPSLVADDKGRVYVSWWDGRHGDWDVFTARSADGARSFGRGVRMNDDPVGNGRHQYLPRLSVSDDGRLDAIFYDRRDDPENVRNHVSYTSSLDGGRSFTPNLRITTASFFSDTGSRYPIPSAEGLVEFGSRIALHSGRSGALAAWTDTRMAPRGQEHQDVFAARITLGGDAAPPSRWEVPTAAAAAGVMGVGAGLAVLVGVRLRRRRRSP